jgi:diguanylate cyclase (GGDEF)-like protein
LDLNGFKQVNDTYGHDVGDMLLEAVAERLQKLMRDSDTLARMGGDEFVILLPQIEGQTGINALVQRIYTSFQTPFALDSVTIQSRTSIGFALFPDHGNTVDILLHVADQNMYKVKQSGQNLLLEG